MTERVNSKLLVMLGLAVAVAAVGAWRLVSVGEESTETGFDQTDGLPAIVVDGDGDGATPVVDITGPIRNPFERTDGLTALDPGNAAEDGLDTPTDASVAETGGATTEATTSTTAPPEAATTTSAATESSDTGSSPAPVFPDPDLVDQEAEASAVGR